MDIVKLFICTQMISETRLSKKIDSQVAAAKTQVVGPMFVFENDLPSRDRRAGGCHARIHAMSGSIDAGSEPRVAVG